MYTDAVDLPAFLTALNASRIGGGRMRLEDGVVIAAYDKCYCGLAKNNAAMPGEYCHCSEGWFGGLFAAVLQQNIRVEKIETILTGARQCTFKIYLP